MIKAIVLIVIGVALKMFVIGKTQSVANIVATSVDVQDSGIEIKTILPTSADMYKKYTYKVESDVMYIQITTVLVGGISNWDGNISITGDFLKLKEIYFQDANEKDLIWQRK